MLPREFSKFVQLAGLCQLSETGETGIEPALVDLEATVLPLDDSPKMIYFECALSDLPQCAHPGPVYVLFSVYTCSVGL